MLSGSLRAAGFSHLMTFWPQKSDSRRQPEQSLGNLNAKNMALIKQNNVHPRSKSKTEPTSSSDRRRSTDEERHGATGGAELEEETRGGVSVWRSRQAQETALFDINSTVHQPQAARWPPLRAACAHPPIITSIITSPTKRWIFYFPNIPRSFFF